MEVFDFYLMDYTMSGKRVRTFYDPRRRMWRLLWGNETFYDDNNEMIEFETEQEAIEWWANYPRIKGLEVTVTGEGSNDSRD